MFLKVSNNLMNYLDIKFLYVMQDFVSKDFPELPERVTDHKEFSGIALAHSCRA
jgi:hypothetical protein